jgi:hypothetical protein
MKESVSVAKEFVLLWQLWNCFIEQLLQKIPLLYLIQTIVLCVFELAS